VSIAGPLGPRSGASAETGPVSEHRRAAGPGERSERGGRSRSVRNALGSLAILAILALMAFGFPLIDRSMPSHRAVAAAVAYRIGGKVTMVPPPRASVDLTRTRPGDDRGTAMFVVDGVRLGLLMGPYHGTLSDAATRLHDKITNTTGFQVTGADRQVRSVQGVVGLRGAYSSPGRLGEYAVFVADNVYVEVTISGPEHRLRALAWQLDASVRSVTFGAGG
jgi:hypothetical protein